MVILALTAIGEVRFKICHFIFPYHISQIGKHFDLKDQADVLEQVLLGLASATDDIAAAASFCLGLQCASWMWVDAARLPWRRQYLLLPACDPAAAAAARRRTVPCHLRAEGTSTINGTALITRRT